MGGIYSDTRSQAALTFPFLGTGMDLAVGYRAVCKPTRSRDREMEGTQQETRLSLVVKAGEI